MPDWSYHPLLEPAFRRLPARGRRRALDAVGAFGHGRFTGRLVAAFADAQPPPVLARSVAGLALPGPLGVSADLPGATELSGFLARLGPCLLEVGPVALPAQERPPAPSVRPDPFTLVVHRVPSASPEALRDRLLRRGPPAGAFLAVRLQGADAGAGRALAASLPDAAAFVLETEAPPAWMAAVVDSARATRRPVLASLDALAPDLEASARQLVQAGCAGVVVRGGVRSPDGLALGRPGHLDAVRAVRRVRAALGPGPAVLASGTAVEPQDAVDLVEAGADVVLLDAGLALSGPGLPKRIHAALHRRATPPEPGRPPRWGPWQGTLLLGLGMVVCGLAVAASAAWRVLLPYDEAFLSASLEQVAALNPRLPPFLAHDRATLAGTMVAVGVLYAGLGAFPQRRGQPWARRAVAASAAIGFASFFLFLGFGYFDPLHAAIAIALFPFLLWGLRRSRHGPCAPRVPDLRNDAAWRRALWGQLGFVLLGVGLVAAGLAIAGIGLSAVFVPSDLDYLGTTGDALRAANPRLVPLIAHDRAGFGGALVSNGVGVLLAALWGVRRGAAWLWWSFLAAGSVGFGLATVAHAAVGYTDAGHLLPVALGGALFLASLAALRGYLVDS